MRPRRVRAVAPQSSRGSRWPRHPAETQAREELRAWRLETSARPLPRTSGRSSTRPASSIYAYNYSSNASFTDEEIDRGFEMAKALGAEIITASTTLDVAKRIAPFAEKHKMVVAMHGHSRVDDPNEFATPESFAEGDEDVEVLQGQPRHRPFHGRQLRRDAVLPRAPRPHHEPAPQGSQDAIRATTCRGAPAIRRFARCCSCSSANGGRSARTSNTSTRARARRSMK